MMEEWNIGILEEWIDGIREYKTILRIEDEVFY